MNDIPKPVKGIGGSDIGGILGISPFNSPRDVYHRVFGLTEERDNASLEWGKRLEQPVIDKFFDTRPDVMYRRYQDKLHVEDWAEGTADESFAVIEEDLSDSYCILDAKTAGSHMRSSWGPDGSGVEGIPPYIVVQLRFYMWMASAKVGFVAVLIGGQDYREYEIPHDQAAEDEIVDAARDFWETYILTATPPPLTAKDSKSFQPEQEDNAGIISANAESEEAILELKDADECAKLAASRLDLCKVRVKELIGPNAGITGPGYTVTYRADKNGKRTLRPKFDKGSAQ